MHAFTYTRMYICMHACTYAPMHVCMYVPVCRPVHGPIRIGKHVCVYRALCI